jgi:hypothetical protein
MLTALVSATEANGESTGPDRSLAELCRRRGVEDREDMNCSARKLQRRAVPAALAGAAQLRATVKSSYWNKSAVLNPKPSITAQNKRGESGQYSREPKPSIGLYNNGLPIQLCPFSR